MSAPTKRRRWWVNVLTVWGALSAAATALWLVGRAVELATRRDTTW